jgi:hypothetical protein
VQFVQIVFPFDRLEDPFDERDKLPARLNRRRHLPPDLTVSRHVASVPMPKARERRARWSAPLGSAKRCTAFLKTMRYQLEPD